MPFDEKFLSENGSAVYLQEHVSNFPLSDLMHGYDVPPTKLLLSHKILWKTGVKEERLFKNNSLKL